ncbi:hypothetical protein B0H11DRAFT_2182309 [Mycena galericulata]|nr:hypothetical protein B0H11DRAFT_2182309 [Mycena galericulata]
MSDSSPSLSVFLIQRKRAFIACSNCRKRKVKASALSNARDCSNLNDESGQEPCKRCTKKGLDCEYVAVSGQNEPRPKVQQSPPPPTPGYGDVSSSQGPPTSPMKAPAEWLDPYPSHDRIGRPISNLHAHGQSGIRSHGFDYTHHASSPRLVSTPQPRPTPPDESAYPYPPPPFQVPSLCDFPVAHVGYPNYNSENLVLAWGSSFASCTFCQGPCFCGGSGGTG